MRHDFISAVLVVTAVISFFSLVEGTHDKEARRYLFHSYLTSNSSTNYQGHGTGYHCGPSYCVHGSCIYQSLNGVVYHSCKCSTGWYGDLCDQPTALTTTTNPDKQMIYDSACNYHGQMKHFGCSCHDNWTGDTCQYPPGSIHYDHCKNHCGEHGTCTRHLTQYGHEYWICKCFYGWHGQYCTIQNTYVDNTTLSTTPTSAATTSTTSTEAPTTSLTSSTTAAPIASLYRCDHAKIMRVLAYQTQVSHPNAVMCAQGQRTSHEALVLTECDIPKSPGAWKQGVNVMSSCASSSPIPDLTPVASFDHGHYSSADCLSGILLGCTSNGFKVALQICGQSPEITELRLGDSFNRNPNNYFAIV